MTSGADHWSFFHTSSTSAFASDTSDCLRSSAATVNKPTKLTTSLNNSYISPINQKQQNFNEYSNRFSLHHFGRNLDLAPFNLYASCPCVISCSESSESLNPPTPPERRAESFLCVAHHIKKRAKLAQQSYDKLFRVRQKKLKVMNEQDSRELVIDGCSNGDPDIAIIMINAQGGESIAVQPDPPTPSFTPPPPLHASNNKPSSDSHKTIPDRERTQSPMFIYSYDPPTPERYSEYDPPLPNFMHSQSASTNEDLTQNKFARSDIETRITDSDLLNVPHASSTRPPSNISSTLSASLLLTQDSGMSPLPPHANRVSPMNTDTLTPSSLSMQHLTAEPSATYTCTSPAGSNYSDIITPLTSDISTITINNFGILDSTENLDDIQGQTPDTICVSPLHSQRFSHSQSKTSEDPSQLTQSLSDSQKKSQEGVSDPTNPSSDRGRRSSPPSSPDASLSSLPSDTITMNAGIESIGTDSDPNELSIWSTGNVNRDSESIRSHDDTDQTIDSAFGSPSLSPTFTDSCTITPVAVARHDSCLPSSNTTHSFSVPEEIQTSSCSFTDLQLDETNAMQSDSCNSRLEDNSILGSVDEYTENESIYPESECEIRLVSRADTDVVDSAQKESSPERPSTPIIAELCNLENRHNESTNESFSSPVFQEPSNRILNEISSSGNSSMSNSPALSTDQWGKRPLQEESLHHSTVNYAANSHLSNWLNDNQRSYNLVSDFDSSVDNSLLNFREGARPVNGFESNNNGVTIEELSSEPFNYSGGNGGRSFTYFGPLPTIHEVVDTPNDQTHSNEVTTVLSLDKSPQSIEVQSNKNTSSIISSLVHSDSTQNVSTTGSSPRNTSTPIPFLPPPPPPPPRIKVSSQRTPPVPPPPEDEESVNLFPLPPPPSEADCLPPLPPPPVSFRPSATPPPVPPHAPSPPQRMYLLIPLAPGLRTPRKLSPPPAPLRSTSLRRSPPPPPPRSAVQTPIKEYTVFDYNSDLLYGKIAGEDFDEEDIRSPSSTSDVGSVICVAKLTPVPEEKPNHSSPLPPALLVAQSDDMKFDNRNSKSPVVSENINNNISELNESNNSPQPISLFNYINTDHKIGTSHSPSFLSISSSTLPLACSPSPPAPPPRGKICLTPPLPPAPSPKVFFSTDNLILINSEEHCEITENSEKTDIFNMNLKKEQSSLNQLDGQTQQPPPPLISEQPLLTPPAPPPPPPKPTGSHCGVKKPSVPMGSCSPTPPSSPLISVSNYGRLIVDRADMTLATPDEEVGRVFSSGLRWGWIAENVDTIAMYTQLKPIIQHGPQCGLVALSMASQLSVGSGSSTRRQSISQITSSTPSTSTGSAPVSTVSAADLLEAARSAGFSTHGEMFSADALAQIANTSLGDNIEASVRRDVLGDKYLFLEMMLAGALILVPYDSQHNHQPGKYRGHKAHWGIVSGALVQSRCFAQGTTSAASFARPDARIDWLWHVRRGYHGASSRPSSRGPSRIGPGGEVARIVNEFKRDRSVSPSARCGSVERVSRGRSMTPIRGGSSMNQTALDAFRQVETEDLNVIVLWRQGKSRQLISSSLDELCASNAQLLEYPEAEADGGFETDFIVGNVEEGLAGQVVVLNRTTQPLTALSELLERLQS